MRSDDEVISQFRHLFWLLAAFLSLSGFLLWERGRGGGRRAGGCRGIRKRSPSGLHAPGAPEKEVRDARFATVSALGFIVFVGLWFCWSWSEECRSF